MIQRQIRCHQLTFYLALFCAQKGKPMAEQRSMTRLLHKDTLENFRKYLVPSMLSMMLMAVYTFTDTFVVGQKLGATALGAMGVCTPVLTVAYAFGFLFGMGGSSRYAIAVGQSDQKKADMIFSTSVFSTLAFGAAAAVILNLFARPFAFFLGADSSNIAYVMPYLRVLLIYIPGFMMDIVIMCFMKNEGHPTIAMIATVTGTGMNVVLDFLFVFGFGWGMFGAAFATAICSGLGCGLNIAFAYAKRMHIRFHKSAVRLKDIPRTIRNGVSVLVLESSSGIVTFVYIAQSKKLYGTEGAAVYTIIMNWSLICINLVMGIAQAAQPLLGFACGKGNKDHVRDYRRYALISAALLGLLFLLFGYSMTTPLVSVFASDSGTVIRLAEQGFRLYLPAYLLMGPGIVLGYYFQSLGMAGQSFAVMLSRGILLPCILALVMPSLFGGTGLWISVPVAELLTSLLALVLFRKYDRIG